MELGPIDFLQGISSLIFVLISCFLGIKIISRYFQYKKREIALIGLAWIAITSGYIPDAISFIMIVFFNAPLSEPLYFIIGFAFIPFYFIASIIGFFDVLRVDRRRVWIIFFIILGILYEIFFWYLFLSPTESIGVFLAPFQVEFHPLIDIYLLVWIGTFFILGMLFVRETLRSENPEMNLKGKCMLIAFCSFIVGLIMEILIPLTPLTVVITRLILISSAIEFYIGLILPEWIKNLLL
ncbi:MAG: hypothetical protein EU539_05135 [Promethearchaeota archaeon]|nr:MAG: hypothetical protein EU539_05135 [Candidatus Lokiarchaeota archaeon]